MIVNFRCRETEKIFNGEWSAKLPLLIQKRAKHSTYIEEQLKLYGHPDMERVIKADWILTKENTQHDTYLSNSTLVNPSGEVLRLRYEDGNYKFMYKGAAQDELLSHRLPHSFAVENSEAKNILESHLVIAGLKKHRLNFRKETRSGEIFTLHIDDIAELGRFTEIRARGTQDTKHTRELLQLAEELGFKTNSIVNGNYLSLILGKS